MYHNNATSCGHPGCMVTKGASHGRRHCRCGRDWCRRHRGRRDGGGCRQPRRAGRAGLPGASALSRTRSGFMLTGLCDVAQPRQHYPPPPAWRFLGFNSCRMSQESTGNKLVYLLRCQATDGRKLFGFMGGKAAQYEVAPAHLPVMFI